MGLTGLLLGGAGIAIVGSAIANGQGGALLEFAKNALGRTSNKSGYKSTNVFIL